MLVSAFTNEGLSNRRNFLSGSFGLPLLYYTTLHFTTLHYTTLHYTTLHFTTLDYTTGNASRSSKVMVYDKAVTGAPGLS